MATGRTSHNERCMFSYRPLLGLLLSLLWHAHSQADPACLTRLGATPDAAGYACLRAIYQQPPAHWPPPQVDAGVTWRELGPLPERLTAPAGNPDTPAKVALGEKLFFDPRLSRSQQIACASCHEPDLAFADGRRVSFGHQRAAGKRNSPSAANAGLVQPLFWDGRAADLESQALMPVSDPLEMAFSSDELVVRLRNSPDYPTLFRKAFADPAPLRAEQIAQALASYQRSLLPRNNRFDLFLQGRQQLLSDQQLHGLHLFRGKARCMNCHSGPALSDNRFHNLGLTYYGRRYEDLGRYLVSGRAEDVGAFRTPSLRQVSRTGPWMHNGLFRQLEGILNLYNAGMPRPQPANAQQREDPLFPKTSPLLQPLQLQRAELQALRAFLDTL